MPTCPNGHQSGSDDWCEVCGHRMAGAVPPPPPPPPGGYGFPPPQGGPAGARPGPAGGSAPEPELCPQCRTPREGGAPFCEECRWNFLTNTATSYTPAAPRPPQPRFQPPSSTYGGGDGYEYQGSRPSQVNRPAEPLPSFHSEPSGPTPFGGDRAPSGPPTSPGPSGAAPFGAGDRRPPGAPQGFGQGPGQGPGAGNPSGPGGPGGFGGRGTVPGQGPGGPGSGGPSGFGGGPGQGPGAGGPGGPSGFGGGPGQGPGGPGGPSGFGGGQGQRPGPGDASGFGGQGPGPGGSSPFGGGNPGQGQGQGPGSQGSSPFGREPSRPGGPTPSGPSGFGGDPSGQVPPPGGPGGAPQAFQPSGASAPPAFPGETRRPPAADDDWVISPPSSTGPGQGGGYGYPQSGGTQTPPGPGGPGGFPQATQAPQGPRSATWTATIGPDREYFMAMMQRSGPEAAGLNLPAYSPEQQRTLTGNQVTIGRRRHSTGDTPDIDLSVPPEDPGVSHQHAVLVQQQDGSWAVVDQNSTNGTTVNMSEEPIQPFVPVPLQDGDRVHVGAWTTITVRRG
ncbi:FHA domain-containing protein [Streptomyces spinosus]|uniref:FHA domain-containing protein n=1 Tax=Streptomyces spinosus TaxID=2872623 RepID=UPI001CED4306|nr:FHA domain-containing protein [Streptomyces spinosus]